MPQTVTLEYSEPLLRKAVFAFWCRTVGVGFFIALAMTLCSFAYLVWVGERSWFVGALGAVLIFGMGFAFMVYFVHMRNTLAKFRGMDASMATLALEDASFTMSSGLGTTSLPWSTVTELWRYPSFWLLLFSKGQFVTLPLASVPVQAQDFILNRVSAAGGKVVC
jgi:hypothetical protein